MNRIALIVLSFFLSTNLLAQVSGSRVYTFLNLPPSAREAALGGASMAHRDGGLQTALSNPALLDARADGSFGLLFSPFIAGMNYGNVTYAKETKALGTVAASMQFFSYGKFTEADETGVQLGEFSAADYALSFMNSRKLSDQIQMGVAAKFIYSSLQDVQSFGFAFDVGASYAGADSAFYFSALVKNVGSQIVPYQNGEFNNLPLDVQLAISRKVAKAPFRVMAAATSLQRWDLRHDYQLTADQAEARFNLDMLMRHFVLGLEFVPSNKFNLRLGYNYRRQRELQLDDRTGAAGFSGGLEFKTKKYSFSYGFARYHLSSTSHHLNLILNFKEFKRRTENS